MGRRRRLVLDVSTNEKELRYGPRWSCPHGVSAVTAILPLQIDCGVRTSHEHGGLQRARPHRPRRGGPA